jgi:hypothetical protein
VTALVALFGCLDAVAAALAAVRWCHVSGWQARFECWFWGAGDPGLPAPPDYGVPAYLAWPAPVVLAWLLAWAWSSPAAYGLLSTAAALGAAHVLLSRAANRARAIESTGRV